MNTNVKTMALLITALVAGHAGAQQAADGKSDIGTISISGEGDKLGAGQIIQEDSPKARSTVTRAAMDKQRPTANTYQALNLLPGVNTYNFDATGLFGGGMRVRGFNSDQMGYTIDGAPVNDSGSFSIYPQEYTDQENTCEIFVTQGSTDTDAPHVGATGGNVGIVTCDPEEKLRIKLQQTLGSLKLNKTFVRLDSGTLPVASGWRSFVSYSHASVDKFKGPGEADRDHVDFKSVLDLGGGSRVGLTGILNDAINNNYRTLTKAQIDQLGRNYDYSNTFIANPAGGPGRQTAPTQDIFYKLSINPFRNAIFTGKGNFQINPALRFDLEPYFWYGYGTGGTQQFNLNEGGTFRGGVQDVNGDGDRLDTVTVYRSSVTRTYRPGVTAKVNWQVGNQKIVAGYWFERARHRQTAPATFLNADGTSADLWLQNAGLYIRRADGTPYNNRDQLTITTVDNVFLQDSLALMKDRVNVQLGVKHATITRDFWNYANEGFGQSADYNISQKFNETLPSAGVRFQIDETNQVFAGIAKNYKIPGNFVYGGAFVNGALQIDTIKSHIRPETSINADIGYRYLGKMLTFSGTLFNVDFKDRLARSFQPIEGITIDTNVGDARTRGVEMEAGTRPVNGFSIYASLAYTISNIKNDLTVSGTNTQPTSGKEFPDTPNWLAGLSLQYAAGPYYANAQTKYTGKRYATLTNDESAGGYTLTDLNLGFKLPPVSILKNVIARLSVSNLFDTKYLGLNSGSGSLLTTNATGTGASSPGYYVGAPRFTSVSISAEF
jgi:iron complex outermembrane receptor protein